MNDIERPTAGELAEAVAELANEVDLTRGLNVYVELPGDIAEVLLAALRCAAEDAEKMQEMRRWVDDLQSGMYVNCVYCGHRYGPGDTTPVSMADALKAHIEECPDHPMSALREKMQEMREALETLAAREVVFDGSDPFEMDCYTPEDARRQGAEDAETLLARTLLGGTR